MKVKDYSKKLAIFLLSSLGCSLIARDVQTFNSETHKYVTTSSLEFMKNSSNILGEVKKLNEKENYLLHEICGEYKEHITA